MSELNARLRRIVAAFQKSHKKELMKQEQNEKVCYVTLGLWCGPYMEWVSEKTYRIGNLATVKREYALKHPIE